jgi:hypothetical protein
VEEFLAFSVSVCVWPDAVVVESLAWCRRTAVADEAQEDNEPSGWTEESREDDLPFQVRNGALCRSLPLCVCLPNSLDANIV